MWKPFTQFKFDLVMFGICATIYLIRWIEDWNPEWEWGDDIDPSEQGIVVRFVKSVKKLFPQSADMFLMLYLAKPLVAWVTAKKFFHVHMDRVYYSKTVFTIRILYNMIIFVCIFNSFNLSHV